MKVSTWLVLQLVDNGRGRWAPRITGTRTNRPQNAMAVRVTLDIDPDALQPHAEALVDAGLIQLTIEPPDPEVDDDAPTP